MATTGIPTILQSVGRGGANLPADVTTIQQLINANLPSSLSPLDVDGQCGPDTIAAIEAIQSGSLNMNPPDGRVDPGGRTFQFLIAGNSPSTSSSSTTSTGTTSGSTTSTGSQIAWGARVSPAFKAKVIQIGNNLGIDPSFLMSAMAFESGQTFSPSVKNAASGATGLIQFMPSIAISLGTTTAELAAMTAEDQLDFVAQYFAPHQNKLSTIEDVYMTILWPAAIGKPNSFVLFSAPSVAYKENAGLDADKDGNVTKEEAAARVRAMLAKGTEPGNIG